MLDLNSPPDPPGSAIEKLLTESMLGNPQPRLEALLSENPTREELLRAFSYMDERIAGYVRRHSRALEQWANVHTHPQPADAPSSKGNRFALKALDSDNNDVILILGEELDLVKKIEMKDLTPEDPLDFAAMNVISVSDGTFVGSSEYYFDNYNDGGSIMFGMDAEGGITWKLKVGFESNRYANTATEQAGILYVSHVDPPGVTAYRASDGTVVWESGVEGANHPPRMSISDNQTVSSSFGGNFNPTMRLFDMADGSVVLDEKLGFDTNVHFNHEHRGLLVVSINGSLRAYTLPGLGPLAWELLDNTYTDVALDHTEGMMYVVGSDGSSGAPNHLSRIDMYDGTVGWSRDAGSAPVLLGAPEARLEDTLLFMKYSDGTSGQGFWAIRRSDGGAEWDTGPVGPEFTRHCSTPGGFAVIREEESGQYLDTLSLEGGIVRGEVELFASTGCYIAGNATRSDRHNGRGFQSTPLF